MTEQMKFKDSLLDNSLSLGEEGSELARDSCPHTASGLVPKSSSVVLAASTSTFLLHRRGGKGSAAGGGWERVTWGQALCSQAGVGGLNFQGRRLSFRCSWKQLCSGAGRLGSEPQGPPSSALLALSSSVS